MPNVWTIAAGLAAGQINIHCLVEFNGKIYGGTGDSAKLFEWNGSNAWIDRATLATGTDIFCLVVYKNQLYGGSDDGKLVRWDGVSAWVEIADIGTPQIRAFLVFQGNLYFSTSQLYRWTGLGGPAPSVVAAGVLGQTGIHSLINYNGNIYGGTTPGGRLFRWTGAAWTQVAAQYGTVTTIHSLTEYEGKIFGAAGGLGELLEWSGTAWILRASRLLIQNDIYALRVHHENKIMGGTSNKAHLFMWDGVSAWLEVAPQATNEIGIHSLIEFEDDVYGGSYNHGRLYKWSSLYPQPPTGLLVCDLASSIGPDGECVPAIIDTIMPYFSAIFNHPHQHAVADHYRIQVNTQYDLAGTVMWDSGKSAMANVAEGDRCENLYYGGTLPSIGVTYYWRIMFYDDDGFLGDWSEVNCFRIEFGEDGPPPPPDPKPPKYKLVIGDHILMCEADKQNVFEMHFTLRQNGGCAEFNVSLKAPEFIVKLGDQVSIYLFGSTTPWYTGRVLERDSPGSSSTVRKYSGYGHFEQLNGCDLVDVEYGTGFAINDLRTAVIDILDVDVRAHTSLITTSNSKIIDPTYPITHIKFDKVKPIDALRDLAELAKNYEFGVDEVGDFYFRPISTAILHKKWVGKHVKSLFPTENMRTLRNYLYLEGGQLTAGSNYDKFVKDDPSILAYGRRADKVTIPSGMDTNEIDRWGNDLLAKTKDPITKIVIIGIDVETTQLRIWPSGQMRCTSEDGRYVFDKPIIAVTYHITPAGITSADVQLGEKMTSMQQQIRDVEKKVSKEQEQLAHDTVQLAPKTIVVRIADISTAETLYLMLPKCRITKIWSVLSGAIVNVDATITANRIGAAMANGIITIAVAGSAAGVIDSCTPTTNNNFDGSTQYLKLVGGGESTNAVPVLVTIEFVTPG